MIWLLLAACSPSDPTPAPAAEPARPDVLLVTLDTFRADAMGAYGNRFEPTPNLDALAARGVRFDRAFTVTPLTIPAHSSVHTGLYPPRHGVRDNGDYFLSEDAVTLAERLKDSGYATMAAVGAEVTSHRWGFAQGFDAYFDDLGAVEAGGNRWKVERPGAEVLADAVQWLDTERSEPEFAWVHFFDAHDPYEAPAPVPERLTDRPYLAEANHVDNLVGQLLEHVDEDTYVIIVADHGEGLGEHGEALHGMLLYNGTTRIPMLMAGPGIDPAVVDAPMSLVDITPTVLGLAGIEHRGLDGMDVSAALLGDGTFDADRDVYVESLYAWRHYGWAKQHALVDAEYKLIESTTDKLFHRSDATESTDLASDASLVEPRVERLGEMMASWEGRAIASPVQGDAQLSDQLAALGYATTVVQAAPGPLPDPESRIGLLPRLETLRTSARSGDLDATREAVTTLIAEEPGLLEPRTLLAGALLTGGEPAEARDVALEALALQDTANIRLILGQAEMRLGNRAEGLSNLEAAVRMDPGVMSAWIAWLDALLIVQDAPRLQAESAKALEVLPHQPQIQALAGVGLALTGELDTAEPILTGLMQSGEAPPMVRHGLGTIAQERGDGAEAERLYRAEIQAYPPGIPSRRYLVALYAAQQDYDRQLAELEQIAELEPPSAITRLARAQALFNLQRYDEALPMVQGCLELVPGTPACKMLEANTLHKLGREEEALAALQAARAAIGAAE